MIGSLWHRFWMWVWWPGQMRDKNNSYWWAARRLNIDLCLELGDLTVEQLQKNIRTAERWIAEL